MGLFFAPIGQVEYPILAPRQELLFNQKFNESIGVLSYAAHLMQILDAHSLQAARGRAIFGSPAPKQEYGVSSVTAKPPYHAHETKLTMEPLRQAQVLNIISQLLSHIAPSSCHGHN
ncbi:MAG: hypothetical protein RDU24_11610 [Humidesulfovibrio sp.]|nr:hypothetical protein [Humidesulfovibrio sp.]